jgi:PAS domain S-box-containing protein
LAEAEALAQERYEELEGIYRHAPVGLLTLDREYRFVRINEQMAEIDGIPAEEHLGRSVCEIVPHLADRLIEIYRPVLEHGEPVLGLELTGETPSAPGVQRDWLASYFPFRAAGGEIVGLIGAVIEVTERKRAEADLAESEARLSAIMDAIPQMVWSTRPDGYHDFLNRR